MWVARSGDRAGETNVIGSSHCSRRSVLSWGAAALALAPGLGRADATDAPAPPVDGDSIQGVSDANQRLTLETYINGHGPFRFVVDTGADQTIISEDVALKLRLLAGDQVIVQGISRSSPAQTVLLSKLSFGHVTIDSLRVPVLPSTWLGADGYLGLDVIDGRRVIFDFQNDTLTVTDSRGASESPRWLSADQALVRASGAHGRLTAVNCRVDGVHAHAFIDSGAQASIANTQLFARLEEMGKTYIGDFVIPIVGVTGGEAHGRLTRVSSIQLGTLNFTNSTLVISDLPVFDVWGLADRPAILIGMNFLRKTSSLSIDYGSKELLIKVANVGIARAI